ncbi:MAG: glycoside hydrolase family 78 protein [Thermoplasmatota archaeon]
MRPVWVFALLLAMSAVLAGCTSPSNSTATPSLIMVHVEASELSVATVTNEPAGLLWSDIGLIVNGINWTFGSAPNYGTHTFSVDGKPDAADPVEHGDVARILGARETIVHFTNKATGALLFGYTATIPDTTPPVAPASRLPASAATGVSALPTFEWGAVTDPSGVAYTIQYGLDPTFTTAGGTGTASAGAGAGSQAVSSQGGTVEALSQPVYSVPSGSSLASGVTYYWHVRATDGAGNVGAWSPTWSFTTGS